MCGKDTCRLPGQAVNGPRPLGRAVVNNGFAALERRGHVRRRRRSEYAKDGASQDKQKRRQPHFGVGSCSVRLS